MSSTTDHFQQQALERMRAHVADLMVRSPWYGPLLKKRGVDPSQLHTWADLQALPLTSKHDLSLHNEQFRCVPKGRITEYVFTSGTTGKPVQFGLSNADVDRLARNEAYSLAAAGITHSDVVQITTTIDKRFMAGLAYWLGLRSIGAGIVRCGPGNAMGQWETAIECGSTTLIVVPSFLLSMLREWERKGIRVQDSSITKAVCIGEPISTAFGEPNLLAQRIGELCPFALHGTYASTEMATACTEASPFAGHVVPAELMLVEVLNDEGLPVPEGSAGEVVVTPFGVEAMPLLRFRTGDTCTWKWGVDAKGKPVQLLGPVLGRKDQRLKLKGTTLFPAQVVDAMNALTSTPEFVMVCTQDELGGDDLEILVDLEGQPLDQLREHLRNTLRVAPRLTTLPRSAIDTLKWPSGSRKPLLFIDRRSAK